MILHYTDILFKYSRRRLHNQEENYIMILTIQVNIVFEIEISSWIPTPSKLDNVVPARKALLMVLEITEIQMLICRFEILYISIIFITSCENIVNQQNFSLSLFSFAHNQFCSG